MLKTYGPYSILTDDEEGATVLTDHLGPGLIERIRLVVPGSGGLETATLSWTLVGTGILVLTVSSISASGKWCPRGATHDEANGTELKEWALGSQVGDLLPVDRERMQCAVTLGGIGKAATFYVDVAV